jgi:hypothetical protein
VAIETRFGLLAIAAAITSAAGCLFLVQAGFAVAASWRHVGFMAGMLVVPASLWAQVGGVLAGLAVAYCLCALCAFALVRVRAVRRMRAAGATVAGLPAPSRPRAAPLPGSSDESHERARIARAVGRGEKLPTEWEARMAVEIATQQLEQMPRFRRVARVLSALAVAGAVGYLALDGPSLVAGGALLVALMTEAILLPVMSRRVQPRLERALALNTAVLESGGR